MFTNLKQPIHKGKFLIKYLYVSTKISLYSNNLIHLTICLNIRKPVKIKIKIFKNQKQNKPEQHKQHRPNNP